LPTELRPPREIPIFEWRVPFCNGEVSARQNESAAGKTTGAGFKKESGVVDPSPTMFRGERVSAGGGLFDRILQREFLESGLSLHCNGAGAGGFEVRNAAPCRSPRKGMEAGVIFKTLRCFPQLGD